MDAVLNLLVGLVGLLVLIAFLPGVATRFHLPATVILALTGGVLGFFGGEMAAPAPGRSTWGGGLLFDFFKSLRLMVPPADAFIFLFLPILLFRTAIENDIRKLYADIAPILAMAVVAVIVSTILIGYGLWLISGFSIVVCLLVGSILASTDPSAVVSIFRDVGAPRRLGMLVEGESLLNDAAAIVIYGVLLAVLGGDETSTTLHLLRKFLLEFSGGIVVGFILGRLVVAAIPLLQGIATAEATLTIGLAYVSFIIGQVYLGVSGVVAVVTSGLVVGAAGRTRFRSRNWQAMIELWAQLEFWATSLLFIMAGMLIPPVLEKVTLLDIVLLATVVVTSLIARAIVIYGALPLLSKVGLSDKVGAGFRLVMLWGGLRGAIPIALAMAVTENSSLDTGVQRFVATVSIGYALFTLFVQGTTLRPLLRLIRLDRLSPVERALRDRVLALAIKDTTQSLTAAARDLRMTPKVTRSASEEYSRHLVEAEQRDAESGDVFMNVNSTIFGLVLVCNYEREQIFRRFADGTINRSVVQLASADIDRMADSARAQGVSGYMQAARGVHGFDIWLRGGVIINTRLGISAPLAYAMSRWFARMLLQRSVLRDVGEFVRSRLPQLLGAPTADAVEAIIHDRAADADQRFDAFLLQFPDFGSELQRRYLVNLTLLREVRAYERMHHDGLISRDVLEDLLRAVHARRRGSQGIPNLDVGPEPSQLVARVPIFAGLAAEEHKIISRILRTQLALPGQKIVRCGEHGNRMYFISSGAVQVDIPGRTTPVRLGSGEFFGEMAILFNEPRSADVTSIAYCQLLVLEAGDFEVLRRSHRQLDDYVQKVAVERSSALSKGSTGTQPPKPTFLAAG